MKHPHVTFAFILLAFLYSGAVQATPGTLTYQGRIKNSQGAPLEHNGVIFEFSITNPQGTCVMYRETSPSLDMRNSTGVFDVPIGAGTKIFPSAPSFKLLDAFENTGSFNCEGGGTYSPVADDKRLLRVQFFDGIGWRLISPDADIRSVPFAAQAKVAQSAHRLGTLQPSDVLNKANVPLCPVGQYLRHIAPAGTFVCEAAVVSGANVSGNIAGSAAGFSGNLTGDVTGSQSATSVDRIKGTPVVTTGLAAGKVLKFDGTNWAPADDNSGTAGAITSLTGDVTSSGSPAATVTLGDNTVSNAKLQDDSVTSAEILNGTILNEDIAAGAAIADTKLATISTAGKVSGSAINSGTIAGSTAINTSGLIQTSNGLRVYSGANYVELKAPAGLSADSSYQLPLQDGTAGQVLTTDGSGTLNWSTVTSSGGTVTGVTAAAPLASSGGTAPVISLSDSGVAAGTYAKVTVTAKGLVTGGSALSNADIPNLSGDVTSTAGSSSTKVEKIQGVSVDTTAPSLGQVLMYDASKWNVQYFGFGQLRSTVTGNAQMPATCATANKTLNWSAITDTFTCVDIAIANTQVSGLGTAAAKNFGTAAGNLVELDGAGRIPDSLMPTSYSNPVIQNGNSFGATMVVGTNDANDLALEANNSVAMTIRSIGNVGIGTTNPQRKLHVSGGGIQLSNATVGDGVNDGFLIDYNTNDVVFSNRRVGGSLRFGTNGFGNKLTITDAGNVGIGTTSPSELLEVRKSAGWAAAKISSGDSGAQLMFNSTGSTATDGQIAYGSTKALSFTTDAQSSAVADMTILAGGNVGIGTTNPTKKLHVNGDAEVTNLTATSVTANTVSAATLNGSLFFLDGTAAGWTNATLRNQASDGYSGIGLVDNTGNNKGYLAYANSGAGITPSTVTLGTMATTVPLTFSIGGNEAMRVSASTGNVGIGTSSPSSKLHVVQTSDTGHSGLRVRNSANTAEFGIYVDASNKSHLGGTTASPDAIVLDNLTGKVGIGTTSPEVALHVVGNFKAETTEGYNVVESRTSSEANYSPHFVLRRSRGTSSVPTYVQTGDTMGLLTFRNHTASQGATIYSYATENHTASAWGANLTFSTIPNGSNINTPRMTIDQNGNVGVGNTAPAYKLDITGDINSTTRLRIAGTQVCTSAGCTSSSDLRLKKDIQPLDQSLENILKLQAFSYIYKDHEKFGSNRHIGVIAQEVEQIYPEVVVTDPSTGFKSVAYDHLVAPLIEAVKSLHRMVLSVEQRQSKVERQLASKVESLKAESAAKDKEIRDIKAYLCQKDPGAPVCR